MPGSHPSLLGCHTLPLYRVQPLEGGSQGLKLDMKQGALQGRHGSREPLRPQNIPLALGPSLTPTTGHGEHRETDPPFPSCWGEKPNDMAGSSGALELRDTPPPKKSAKQPEQRSWKGPPKKASRRRRHARVQGHRVRGRAHGVRPNPTPTNFNRSCSWEQAGPRKPGFSRNWCRASLVPTRSQALPSSLPRAAQALLTRNPRGCGGCQGLTEGPAP